MHRGAPVAAALFRPRLLMKTRSRPCFAAFCLLALAASALPAQAPHVAGRIRTDVATGLIDGSLCTSRFAPVRTLRFLLNNALNIKTVTDTHGTVLPYRGEDDGRIVGEAREYVVARPDSAAPLTSFCVEYRGAVPVFDHNTANEDWKGRIVDGFGTLRAAEQTRWYPTLFDSASTRAEAEVTYRIEVHCPTCRALYLNGSAPVADTAATFTSAVPRQLMLYVGDFETSGNANVTFVGGAADARTVAAFSGAISRIGELYAKLLGAVYDERPVLLSFTSISRDYHPGEVNWQFVTWPTITFSGGLDFDRIVDRSGGDVRMPPWLWPSLSHEMAHYYFGTRYFPHGPLFWFALESTAEYLALVTTEEIQGEVPFVTRQASQAANFGQAPYPALAAIRGPDEIDATQRYALRPLQLLVLESRTDRSRVMAMLRGILAIPPDQPVDYPTLTRIALDAGISAGDVDAAFSTSAAEVRRFVNTRAHAVLATSASLSSPESAIQLGLTLVNVDTSTTGRLQVLRALQQVLTRDSTRLVARYQIGKIAALTGRELDVGEAALRYYLARPVAPDAPTHADAKWRLGMILERRGDRAGAAALYREVLAENPSHAGAKEAFGRLEH